MIEIDLGSPATVISDFRLNEPLKTRVGNVVIENYNFRSVGDRSMSEIMGTHQALLYVSSESVSSVPSFRIKSPLSPSEMQKRRTLTPPTEGISRDYQASHRKLSRGFQDLLLGRINIKAFAMAQFTKSLLFG